MSFGHRYHNGHRTPFAVGRGRPTLPGNRLDTAKAVGHHPWMSADEPHPVRKRLPHGIPVWVQGNPIWFITICALERGGFDLVSDRVSEAILKAVEFYHSNERWHAHLFLLMPDHVHGLIAFNPGNDMGKCIAQWKSYTAKVTGIRWQRDFFDHRLRSNESLSEKARYIWNNPVRAGLVELENQWPHVWAAPDTDMPPYILKR